jgi:hypothetical protein
MPQPSAVVASATIGEATFGDRRRRDRLHRLVGALAAAPGASLSEACGGDWGQTQAAYRLLDNAQVSVAELSASISAATRSRLATDPATTVLLVADTTAIVPTSARGAQDLGPLTTPGSQGLLLHTTAAVTPEGVPLGLAHLAIRVRDAAAPLSRSERYRTPVEGKESGKWLAGIRGALEQLAAHQRGILVADREADIFELYHLCQTHHADLVVRAAQNRCLAAPAGKLADAALAAPVRGLARVAVGRARERAPRQTTVTIRSTTVTLAPPQLASYAAARRRWWADHPAVARLVPADLAPLSLGVVEVTEDTPPAGVTPLHWRLLTTLPIDTLAACQTVIDGYAKRWLVERFHYVLKSGCRLEQLQLEAADRWRRATLLLSVVAWQLLWLSEIGRQQPGVSAATVVPSAVWQAVGALVTGQVPHTPPDLATLVAQLGRLGGHLGRAGDGPPGVKTLWRGLRRVQVALDLWHLLPPADTPRFV